MFNGDYKDLQFSKICMTMHKDVNEQRWSSETKNGKLEKGNKGQTAHENSSKGFAVKCW